MFQDANITVNAPEFEKSLDFYSKTLNMRVEFRQGNLWAEILGPGIRVGLLGKPAEKPSESGPSIGFAVADIEAAVKTLSEKGVVFPQHIQQTDLVRVAPFFDPAGTPLYLYQIERPI